MGLSMVQVREALRAEIAAQMQNTADKMSGGRPRDYAEYRESVGRIAGGKDALDAVDEVFRRFFVDEED